MSACARKRDVLQDRSSEPLRARRRARACTTVNSSSRHATQQIPRAPPVVPAMEATMTQHDAARPSSPPIALTEALIRIGLTGAMLQQLIQRPNAHGEVPMRI